MKRMTWMGRRLLLAPLGVLLLGAVLYGILEFEVRHRDQVTGSTPPCDVVRRAEGGNRISGTVRMQSGEPLAGVAVSARTWGSGDDEQKRITTDSDGRFAFTFDADDVEDATLLIQGLPEGTRKSKAFVVKIGDQRVSIVLGVSRTLHGQLLPIPEWSEGGCVVPAVRARWSPESRDDPGRCDAELMRDGTFELPQIPRSSPTLVWVLARELAKFGLISKPVWVKAADSFVHLESMAGLRITGTVFLASGAHADYGYRVNLYPPGGARFGRALASAPVRGGRFTFDCLPPGKYTLQVKRMLASASGSHTTGTTVALVNGVEAGALGVNVQGWTDPARLPVRVVGGAPNSPVLLGVSSLGLNMVHAEERLDESGEYSGVLVLPTRSLNYEIAVRAPRPGLQIAGCRVPSSGGSVTMELQSPAVIEGRVPDCFGYRWTVCARRTSTSWFGRKFGREFSIPVPDGVYDIELWVSDEREGDEAGTWPSPMSRRLEVVVRNVPSGTRGVLFDGAK